MKEIQSAKNTLIKELKKLQQRKYREQERKYLIEGFHLVEEAIQNCIEAIFFNQKGLENWSNSLEGVESYLLSDEAFHAIAMSSNPQGVIALIRMDDDKSMDYEGRWLLLDNVQDPGNVGTMIRTADAAGFSGVVLGDGCADLYNDKVLRSMQGSHFHISVLRQNLQTFLPILKKNGFSIFGTELNESAVDYRLVDTSDKFALILGNEGQGVSAELLAETDKNIYIPLYGKAESLNVGVAAGILMYHYID